MQTTTLQSLIQFYDQTQNTVVDHPYCSSPIPFHQPNSSNTSEGCYQADLEQWLNLGQSRSKPISSHPKLIQHPSKLNPSIQKQLRHQSMPSYPPPVPPRSKRNGSCELIPTKASEKGTRQEFKTTNAQTEHPTIPKRDNQHDPLRSSQTRIRKPSIDLNRFRKAIQSLWFTLLDQYFKRVNRDQSHSHHHFYDHIDRKILLPGYIIRHISIRSGLPSTTLSQIWDSIDQEKTGRMNFEQFLLGMYQISKLRQEVRFEQEVQDEAREDKKDSCEVTRRTSPEMSRAVTMRRRRTPPLIPSSRAGSVSSSSDSCSSNFHHHPPPSRINNTLHASLSKPPIHPFFDLDISTSDPSIINNSLHSSPFLSPPCHPSLLI